MHKYSGGKLEGTVVSKKFCFAERNVLRSGYCMEAIIKWKKNVDG